MKNLTFSKIVFTYVLPLIPLMTAFDGIISCLRTYTPDELWSMTTATGYRWTVGTQPGPIIPVTYLIGIPEEQLRVQ